MQRRIGRTAPQEGRKAGMSRGYVHLYWGDGKGKTTAAMGLALRALGQGKRVLVFQFLKNGDSGEVAPLRRLGAEVYAGHTGKKFVFQMTAEERELAKTDQLFYLMEALKRVEEWQPDMIVLDEAGSACALGMADETLLRRFWDAKPESAELVLTGHTPPEWMFGAADYCTEMRCCAHPYKQGVPARRGIEY